MSFSANMTGREKNMAIAVGVAFFLLLNLMLADFAFKKQRRLRADLAAKQSEWQNIQTLLAERDLWSKRDAWLTENLPKLTNESIAVVELRDYVKNLASSHSIAFENSQLQPVARTETASSVAVTGDLRGDWPHMVAFLHELQQPRHFLVIENGSFEIDPADASKLKGAVRIAKWFAPATN